MFAGYSNNRNGMHFLKKTNKQTRNGENANSSDLCSHWIFLFFEHPLEFL